MREYKEITKSDVGKSTFKLGKTSYPVAWFIGEIIPQDIGKRVYLVNGILQVENDEKRNKRWFADVLDKCNREFKLIRNHLED